MKNNIFHNIDMHILKYDLQYNILRYNILKYIYNINMIFQGNILIKYIILYLYWIYEINNKYNIKYILFLILKIKLY